MENNFKCELISSVDFLLHRFLWQREFEKRYSLWELKGNKFSSYNYTEIIWEWTLLERNWIIFTTVILAGYWIGSFSAISSTPTLILKLFSTGSMHFKSFLSWGGMRRRQKWNFWSCIAKGSLFFSDSLLPNFYSMFLFCEVGGVFFILKKYLRQSTKLTT